MPYVVWDWTEQACRLVSNQVFAKRKDAEKYCDGSSSLAIEPISYTPLGAKLESLVVLEQLRKAVSDQRSAISRKSGAQDPLADG